MILQFFPAGFTPNPHSLLNPPSSTASALTIVTSHVHKEEIYIVDIMQPLMPWKSVRSTSCMSLNFPNFPKIEADNLLLFF